MLDGGGEEGGTVDLLPQAEAGLVSVLANIGQVVADNGPDVVLDVGLLALADQVVAI